MPKVRTSVARMDGPKACPQVKKGQTYYWWRTRQVGQKTGVTRCSLTPPRRSQLATSEYVIALSLIQEDIEDATCEDPEDFVPVRDDWAAQIRAVGEEQSEKLNNMPESLQQGPTGELLQERADECEAWADEMEAIEVELPDREDYADDDDGQAEYDDDVQEAIAAAMSEAAGIIQV